MRVIEPGHIYELDNLDGAVDNTITFVNREAGTQHPGTQTQDVIRVIIDMLDVLEDRTNHCDACLRWNGNHAIIKYFSDTKRLLRLALLLHEQRAEERKIDKDGYKPELREVNEHGHFKY